jgi:chromosome segregation protein
MFLKRLTMKGFKSFADATSLDFEPGVTAVVGPNGSGKSNVVDAVTWVLGAQSARALRSGKMEDVIFAGAAHRAALGRAEVSLTLDNALGKLPIDGAEVTITRTLFRNGESEYAINGTTCRLLDIQELLSDSGVGRHQHMIIGQGQLDSVLNSRPEDRRAVIEEAAGVLKHRRRKERAERRLAATHEHLERLGDLVREVRRQMRPLERQATAARSYADIEAELQAVRRVSFADRLRHFDQRAKELDETLRHASHVERELRHELVTLDAQATAAAGEVASRREEILASTLGTLQGLAERVRGTLQVIGERRLAVRAALDASADENVIATLEADAANLARELAEVEAASAGLAPAREALAAAEALAATATEQYEATWGDAGTAGAALDLKAVTERRELIERTVADVHSSAERLAARVTQLRERHTAGLVDRETALVARGGAEADCERRRSEVRDATTNEANAEAHRVATETALRDVADTAARTQARAEALARALDELSGSSGRAVIGNMTGVLGAFLDLVEVDAGSERAVESAAGASLGAVIVDGRTSARAALAALRREGGVGLVLPAVDHTASVAPAPAGCTPLRAAVRPRAGAPAHVQQVLDALFARAFVAPDWEQAIDLAVAHPDCIIVTTDGDRFATSGWRVASGRAVVTRTSVEEAENAAGRAAQAVAPAREAAEQAQRSASAARAAVAAAVQSLTKAENEFDRLGREVARLEAASLDLQAQRDAVQTEWADHRLRVEELEAELAEIDAQLPVLQRTVDEADQRVLWAAEARATVDAHRQQAETLRADLTRRDTELAERHRLVTQRSEDVERRLAGHAGERQEAAARRVRLEFDLATLDRLEVLVRASGRDVHLNQQALESTYREQLEASRASAERLEELRRQRGATESKLTETSDVVRRSEIEQAELAVKRSSLVEAIARDLGQTVEDLVAVPPVELPEGVTLEQRLAELEARIASLGPINPLALEELTALEDRYRDLDTQVADVRTARRELQEVVRALDDEIMATFSTAVADVNEHFSTLIAMLFPGGQGRLLLTEPDDPLNTGVEIEVRPMGRNVRRVSLLSGGERSMAALAFLFAIFRSRPSPFYLMDEVEAALDDVNLQRFLSLVNEFRDEAQLLIVTHQKRTMEAADALYGVTMAPGASSKVVSQRVTKSAASSPPADGAPS